YDDMTVAQALGIDRKLEALYSILNGDASEAHFATLADDWTLEERVHAALTAWGMDGTPLTRPLNGLSGGEKTRLFLAGMELHAPDAILLDEPTNHLDARGRERLYEFVKRTSASLLVVSHDREFLDGLVEKVYEFGGGQVRECLGGIYEFLEKKKLASLAELERNTIRPVTDKAQAAPQQKPTAQTSASDKQPYTAAVPAQRKLSYAEQREHEKLVRKARKKVEEAEAEIARLEQQVAEIESTIAAGNPPADIYDRHASATKQLENAMSLWELASLEFEEISK
ncbi:MAG: ATP-binding cassette domain-containing protein, partial [Duncaniella sp.]|nr:ATP-binding cassette domain-containing protein [Duncaniella sp.]